MSAEDENPKPGDPSEKGNRKDEAEPRAVSRQADRSNTAMQVFLIMLSLGCLVVGVLAGAGFERISQAVRAPAGPKTVQVTVTASATPMASQTAESTGDNAVSDGTWQVGRDIVAGTWTLRTPEPDSGCYWQISRNQDSGIISNHLAGPGVTVTVVLQQGRWFKSDGCGTWRLQ